MSELPPHDLATEAALVVSCALDPDLRALVTIRPDDFFGSGNRAIATAIVQLEAAGETVDLVNIGASLKRSGRLGDVGDLRALGELFNETPSVSAVQDYAARVSDLARRRRMIDACRQIASEAHSNLTPSFFDRAEATVFSIATNATAEETCQRFGEASKIIFSEIVEAKAPRRLTTGLTSLDGILGGWRDEDLVIVAARPGMGKSAFAGGAAVSVALYEDDASAYAALIMSAEMGRQEFAERALAAQAQVDGSKIQSHRLDHAEMARLVAAAGDLHWLPLWIDDRPAPTLVDIRSRVRRVKGELARWKRDDGKPTKLALVIVDHLQIAGTLPERGKTRSREIGEFTSGLKQIAKSEKLCVMALSQLNRDLEKRSDKRPTLADLRESGDVEQDADRVICLFREDYYDKGTRNRGIAEAIVRKARGGRTGTAFTKWTGAFTQFSDLTKSEEDQLAQESRQ